MRKLGAALLLYLGLASAALGQTNFNMPPPGGVVVMGLQVVTTCGAGSLLTTKPGYATMDTTGALCTNASGGGSGGLSVVDGATFTASTSSFTPSGGEYAATPTTCADGKQCTVAMTTQRAFTIDTPTTNNALYAAMTAAVPALNATAWNTNTYTTGSTSPVNTDLHGAFWMDLGAINGVALLAGNGVTGTGSPRNTIASDNSAIALWGHGATGAAVPANGTLQTGRAASTDPTAVADGQSVAPMMSLTGKQVVLPFALKELAVRGTADSTDGAPHTIIASAGGSLKNYITDWECSNTSATTITVTFTDSVSTKVLVPATGGNNKSLQVPLVTAAATAFQFTSSSGVSTVTCNAQGFTGL